MSFGTIPPTGLVLVKKETSLVFNNYREVGEHLGIRLCLETAQIGREDHTTGVIYFRGERQGMSYHMGEWTRDEALSDWCRSVLPNRNLGDLRLYRFLRNAP